MLHVVGNRGRRFNARQMGRQAFVSFLARLAATVGRDQIGLFRRVGQPCRRVGRVIRIAEVQAKLRRVAKVSLAARLKSLTPQFIEGQFQVLNLLFELSDDVGLGCKLVRVRRKLVRVRCKLFVFRCKLFVFRCDQVEQLILRKRG